MEPDTTTNGFYRYNANGGRSNASNANVNNNVNKIYGFSVTHLSGAGCPLYGDFPILPLSDDAMPDRLASSPATHRDNYAIAFDHKNEEAHPGYYTVTLANGVRVALTVTERAGIARIDFPQGKAARLLVSGAGAITDVHSRLYPPVGRENDSNEITVIADDELSGSVTSGGILRHRFALHALLCRQISKALSELRRVERRHDVERRSRHLKGKHTGAWLDFGSDQPQVMMKVGLSYVSTQNALNNLNKELPGWNFDEVHTQARKTHGAVLLDQIAVEGGTPDQRKLFYTGLYHSFMCPTVFSDENGDYIGFDGKVRALAGSSRRPSTPTTPTGTSIATRCSCRRSSIPSARAT